MNAEGCRKIEEVLAEAQVNAEVITRPYEDQHLPFVTIKVSEGWGDNPSDVLNALWKSGLLESKGPSNTGLPHRDVPKLRYIGSGDFTVTLQDVNVFK